MEVRLIRIEGNGFDRRGTDGMEGGLSHGELEIGGNGFDGWDGMAS